jgi:uncharacterized protein (DUF58 family)
MRSSVKPLAASRRGDRTLTTRSWNPGQLANTNLLAALKQQFSTWLFRPKIESGSITLNQRRVFILPTRQGMGFVGVLTLMLLGDINYNLSLGYVLTFLLTTTGLMTMLYAFRNMARLEIRAGHADPVFAGDDALFQFHFRNIGSLERYNLRLHDGNGHGITFDIPQQPGTVVGLAIPAARRGLLQSGRLTLFTEYPLGLFHAWTYFQFDTRCLVYPEPSAALPLPTGAHESGSGSANMSGDGDFAGLRSYVPGDPLQRVAWKAVARGQGLQVKQFSSLQGEELWLEWDRVPAAETEHKLRMLTRWVLDAEAQGWLYGLRIPGVELPPEHGRPHRDECLRALALFGLEGVRQ